MCIEGGMLDLANLRPLGKIDPRGFYPKLSPLSNATSWGIQGHSVVGQTFGIAPWHRFFPGHLIKCYGRVYQGRVAP